MSLQQALTGPKDSLSRLERLLSTFLTPVLTLKTTKSHPLSATLKRVKTRMETFTVSSLVFRGHFRSSLSIARYHAGVSKRRVWA